MTNVYYNVQIIIAVVVLSNESCIIAKYVLNAFLFSFKIIIMVVRAVSGKKVLGVERNLKMGVPPTQFYLFFMVQSIWIFQETPHPTNFN